MLDAEEAVELRALQARAYGRGGALTADESWRLAELDAKRVARSDEDVPTDGVDAPREDAVVARDDRMRNEPSPTVESTSTPASTPASSPASARRLRWPLIAAALLVVFALGATAGWLLSRPSEHEVELSPVQAAWQQELIDGGEYDDGSIRAMTVEDGMVIWAATQDRGLTTCLVLGDAEERVPSCTSTEIVRSSGFDTVRTVDADGELKRQVSARLFLTPEDEPAVIAGSFLMAPPDELGMSYRDASEAATAEELVERGLERSSVWVVGYDGEKPVWTGIKESTGQTCLAYDTSHSESEPMLFCEELMAIGTGQRGIGYESVDEDTGETTSLTFTYGEGPSYLQITRVPAPGGAE
jgi:hypothetical protein